MRVLFDAQGSTERSGGMRLHAVEIVSGWAEQNPQDSLTVIGGTHLDRDLASYPNISIVHWPNESVLLRAPGQLIVEPLFGMLCRADAVISLSPIVSPLWRGMSVCFQHDWRHIRRPEEFGALQRIYRLLWQVSARFARQTVCISQKAQRETLELVPGARTVVIPNGRDHARRWVTTGSPDPAKPKVVTFGHHNNKRPELVIQGLALISRDLPVGWSLDVLGARGEYAESLLQLAQGLGVASHIRFPGFVTDEQYQQTMSSASCIVMASSDEGFGLPLAEAEYLGAAAVVAADSGVADLFPKAVRAEPIPEGIAEAIGRALGGSAAAQDVTECWTWAEVVRELRNLVTGSGR